jgi:hypothetical protein
MGVRKGRGRGRISINSGLHYCTSLHLRFPPLRPCRDSLRRHGKVLSEQILLDDQTEALSSMISKMELGESASAGGIRPGIPISSTTQVGQQYSHKSKPVVGIISAPLDTGTPV